jgi:transcription termination/antitermination protein NusA
MAAKIKYDNALLKLMFFFENATHTKLRDCFEDENGMLIFVVEQAQLGLAIGKGGANAKKIEEALKRRIRIIEYSNDAVQFVTGIIHPFKATDVKLSEEGIITITAESASRGYIIGRGGSNLKNYENIAKRFFPIKEIRVL